VTVTGTVATVVPPTLTTMLGEPLHCQPKARITSCWVAPEGVTDLVAVLVLSKNFR
jgi:hypothetical protein